MKTKNFLSRFSAAALLAAALIPAALTSCSSDSEPNNPQPNPAPEGFAKLNLTLSTPEMSTTRAESNLTEDEKNVSELWVYFYRKGTDNSYTIWNSFVIDGTTADDSDTGATFSMLADNKIQHQADGKDGYQTIISGMNIPSGTYHIYVLANMKTYKADLQPAGKNFSVTESDFRNSIIPTGATIEPTKLPMAADYTDVTIKDGNVSAGEVVINSGAVTIQSTMTILCSKVRFSVLFDNTETVTDGTSTFGHSYPYASCELQTVKLNNYNQAAPLYSMSLQDNQYNKGTEAVNIEWNKVSYPDNSWITGTTPGDDLDKDAGTATTGKLAWQNTIYLTENLSGDSKTNLGVTMSLDDSPKTFSMYLPKQSGTGAENTLTRGNFYDVIGKITTEGMAFEVKIKPWATTTIEKHPL